MLAAIKLASDEIRQPRNTDTRAFANAPTRAEAVIRTQVPDHCPGRLEGTRPRPGVTIAPGPIPRGGSPDSVFEPGRSEGELNLPLACERGRILTWQMIVPSDVRLPGIRRRRRRVASWPVKRRMRGTTLPAHFPAHRLWNGTPGDRRLLTEKPVRRLRLGPTVTGPRHRRPFGEPDVCTSPVTLRCGLPEPPTSDMPEGIVCERSSRILAAPQRGMTASFLLHSNTLARTTLVASHRTKGRGKSCLRQFWRCFDPVPADWETRTRATSAAKARASFEAIAVAPGPVDVFPRVRLDPSRHSAPGRLRIRCTEFARPTLSMPPPAPRLPQFVTPVIPRCGRFGTPGEQECKNPWWPALSKHGAGGSALIRSSACAERRIAEDRFPDRCGILAAAFYTCPRAAGRGCGHAVSEQQRGRTASWRRLATGGARGSPTHQAGKAARICGGLPGQGLVGAGLSTRKPKEGIPDTKLGARPGVGTAGQPTPIAADWPPKGSTAQAPHGLTATAIRPVGPTGRRQANVHSGGGWLPASTIGQDWSEARRRCANPVSDRHPWVEIGSAKRMPHIAEAAAPVRGGSLPGGPTGRARFIVVPSVSLRRDRRPSRRE